MVGMTQMSVFGRPVHPQQIVGKIWTLAQCGDLEEASVEENLLVTVRAYPERLEGLILDLFRWLVQPGEMLIGFRTLDLGLVCSENEVYSQVAIQALGQSLADDCPATVRNSDRPFP